MRNPHDPLLQPKRAIVEHEARGTQHGRSRDHRKITTIAATNTPKLSTTWARIIAGRMTCEGTKLESRKCDTTNAALPPPYCYDARPSLIRLFLPGNNSLVQDKGLTNNSQLPASTVQGTDNSTSFHRCRHSRPSPSTPCGETHSAQQSAPEIHGLRPTRILHAPSPRKERHELRASAVARRHRGLWFSQCSNSKLTAAFKDTVLPSESPSRRWRSPSTPDTSAPSAARPLSSATLSASGTASLASAPLRKFNPSSRGLEATSLPWAHV